MIPSRVARTRSAYTLIEVLLVSSLMTMLAIIVAGVWSGMGGPIIDAISRARVAQEANMAAAALARDFGGNLDLNEGSGGALSDGKLIGVAHPGGTILRLCFDGGASPNGTPEWTDPDTVISYQVDNGNLIRWNELSGATFVVARYVDSLELSDVNEGVEIRLTYTFRKVTRTYTLVGVAAP
jgi:type II secretory pathway pseudopilin PulG